MAKNLVVCCDGTANSSVGNRTNVLRLWLALERGPGQLAHYDPGVGTLGAPDALTAIGRKLSRALDKATGKGVRQNVLEAYTFLMENYEVGDQIFLFGFSRGAYTVRALAGMLDMYGLLSKGSSNFVPYIWQMYSNDENDSLSIGRRFQLGDEFKRINSRPTIRLIGVWDTVSSWGWFFNYRSLPRTRKFDRVEHIRHAVAIDERRAAFRQNLFDPAGKSDLQEVWFPGVHSDVGGGYPEEDSGLAKGALEWMLAESELLGLRVDPTIKAELLGYANPDNRPAIAKPDACGTLHESLAGGWRILEFLPRPVWIKDEDRRRIRCNRGARRYFREDGSAVHLSVGVRHKVLGYSPKHLVVEGDVPAP